MPSLERFFNPQMRVLSLNLQSLPSARLYFFAAGSSTPKPTYADKPGNIANTNPVIADPNGVFPTIFLDGLYRVELRSAQNIVQPGWPIDNVGQDNVIVPFGPWSEIVIYNQGEVVTGSNGNWYRSLIDNNLGNDPADGGEGWEVIPIPVASTFTSNKTYLSWTDNGDQISLDVDTNGLMDEIEANLSGADGDFEARANLRVAGELTIGDDTESASINSAGEISYDGLFYNTIKTDADDRPKITLSPQNGYTLPTLSAKVTDGILYVYGIAQSPFEPTDTPKLFATLPAGYRPSEYRNCVAIDHEIGEPFTPVATKVGILSNGEIRWEKPSPSRTLVIQVAVPLV